MNALLSQFPTHADTDVPDVGQFLVGGNGIHVTVIGIDNAIKTAGSMVLAPKNLPYYKDQLKRTGITAWRYGFSEVWITKI